MLTKITDDLFIDLSKVISFEYYFPLFMDNPEGILWMEGIDSQQAFSGEKANALKEVFCKEFK